MNRFPPFVRHLVRRLRVLCSTMGKKRVAEMLARAGLDVGVTTVGRMLKEDGVPRPPVESGAGDQPEERKAYEPVTSEHPNHVSLVDLTVAPTSAGFWTAWVPVTLPLAWPFSWWIACALDHCSRRVMGFAVFSKEPSSIDIRQYFGRAIGTASQGRKAAPKYILSDKGRLVGGDPAELYPGMLGVTRFGSDTRPNTSSYYFRPGSEPKYGLSGVTVDDIAETNGVITADVSYEP